MRKTFGIVLIIAGWLTTLMTLMSFIPLVIRISQHISGGIAYDIGYLIGSFVFHFFFGFLSYWIIKKGLKLVKTKKEETVAEKIDSIK